MNSGIYKIENVETGTVYIGQSVNVTRRLKDHLAQLRSQKSHNQHLQFSFNKHGEEAFTFSTLQYCPGQDLTTLEQHYLDYFKGIGPVYNKGECAESPWTGKKFSESHRANLSKSHKGMAPPNKGVACSEDTKARISRSKKGTEAHNKGTPMSEEQYNKLRPYWDSKKITKACPICGESCARKKNGCHLKTCGKERCVKTLRYKWIS